MEVQRARVSDPLEIECSILINLEFDGHRQIAELLQCSMSHMTVRLIFSHVKRNDDAVQLELGLSDDIAHPVAATGEIVGRRDAYLRIAFVKMSYDGRVRLRQWLEAQGERPVRTTPLPSASIRRSPRA